MTDYCPTCSAPLRWHTPGVWLCCDSRPAHWWTAAGMPLVRSQTEPDDAPQTNEPLCPDQHGEEQ